jgi:putative ABC transport system permease protein
LGGKTVSSSATRRDLLIGGAVLVAAGVVAAVVLLVRAPEPSDEEAPTPESRLIVVFAGSYARAARDSLTWDDLEAMQRGLPFVRRAAPVLRLRAQVIAEESNWATTVVGTTADYFEIRRWRAARGRTLDDSDVNSRVVVLGETLVTQLFGAQAEPIGQSVRIKNQIFEIVGVLAHKGETSVGQDQDDVAIVPARTFRTRLQPATQGRLGGSIFAEASSEEAAVQAEESIRQLLRVRHRLAPGDADDFSVRSVGAAMRELQRLRDEAKNRER